MTREPECHACSGELGEDYVTGYLASGTTICRGCYTFLEEEVFTAKDTPYNS